MRERLRPWTSTTVPCASGAGTHQPFRGTPSGAWNVRSSYGSLNEAGVSPSFSLSL